MDLPGREALLERLLLNQAVLVTDRGVPIRCVGVLLWILGSENMGTTFE